MEKCKQELLTGQWRFSPTDSPALQPACACSCTIQNVAKNPVFRASGMTPHLDELLRAMHVPRFLTCCLVPLAGTTGGPLVVVRQYRYYFCANAWPLPRCSIKTALPKRGCAEPRRDSLAFRETLCVSKEIMFNIRPLTYQTIHKQGETAALVSFSFLLFLTLTGDPKLSQPASSGSLSPSVCLLVSGPKHCATH